MTPRKAPLPGSMRAHAEMLKAERLAAEPARPVDNFLAGQFSFVILGNQLRMVCPACHQPVDPGHALGEAYARAKSHHCTF